jgi:membrane AbrB-like protein
MRSLRLPRLALARPTVLRFVWAFALGIVGGLVARAAGAPLPWLLGSVVSVGVAAMFAPLQPSVPRGLRLGFVPVIGVAIGAAFTPGILADAAGWWPSLVALCLFVPAAHWAGYLALQRGGLDRPTAYWAAVPGGLIESVMLGEEAGADAAILTILQFLRLILCIVVVPVGFSLATGATVGSASGVAIGGAAPLAAADWAVLGLCGVTGYFGGRALGLPAAVMTGPLLVSGAAHLAGLVQGAPPRWLIDLTQLVIGVSLGCRFAGMAPRFVATALRLAAVNLLLTLSLAGVAAAILPPLVGEPWEAVLLAFAPGGIAEMSLVALSLDLSILFVTTHHVLRIVLAIGAAKVMARRFG